MLRSTARISRRRSIRSRLRALAATFTTLRHLMKRSSSMNQGLAEKIDI
jgi:hypothetical protein